MDSSTHMWLDCIWLFSAAIFVLRLAGNIPSIRPMKTYLSKFVGGLVIISLCAVLPCKAAVEFQFDYTYDSSGFFAPGSAARSTLEAVGNFYRLVLEDNLSAINSSDTRYYTGYTFRPDTGADIILEDIDVPENALRVYVGACDLGNNVAGQSAAGWYSASFAQYEDYQWYVDAIARGQGSISDVQGPSATEFAPWGGALSIDADANWNFDYKNNPAAGQVDLYSVIVHELAHILGVGFADSWDNSITGNLFHGPTAMAQYGSAIPVTSDSPDMSVHDHWASGTQSAVFGGYGSQEALMTPAISLGKSKEFTELDAAALDDIGWEINYPPGAYGDANLDGMIDDADFKTIAANWLKTGCEWNQGDFNGDGIVNPDDTALVRGMEIFIPEPCRAMLLFTSAAALIVLLAASPSGATVRRATPF